jgi:hypothetical protein
MRVYSKGEVASMYMPAVSVGVAREFLLGSIRKNKALEKELIDAGYSLRAKTLTPKQTRIIFHYLGGP